MEEKLDRIIELLELLTANTKPHRIDFNQVIVNSDLSETDVAAIASRALYHRLAN